MVDLANPTFEALTSFQALLRAFQRARRAKRGKPAEAAFFFRLEDNLLSLQQELRSGTYRPDPLRYFSLHRRKERLVSEASFRDRVVHHALVGALEPVFEPGFIPHSYACRTGFGQHRAVARLRELAGAFRYSLRLDVRRYFDAIRHATLLDLLGDQVTDPAILGLCAVLMAHARVPTVPVGAGRGLPIGNLTSQFWANVYLDPLDQLIMRELGHASYTRYMDDIAVFADDKQTLWQVAHDAERFVEERLGLCLKAAATVVAPVTEGVPWLGLRVSPHLVRLDHAGRRRFARKLRASLDRAETDPAAEWLEVSRAASLCGHLEVADCMALRRAVLTQVLPLDPGRALW